MILYDSNFKLLGMSEGVLSLLGYSDFGSFFSRHSDISELFLDKNSFFMRYDEHFVQKIIKTQKPLLTLIKTANDTAVETIIYADTFFQRDISEDRYVATLDVKNSQNLDQVEKQNSINNYKKQELELPNVFEKEHNKEQEEMEIQRTKEILKGYQIDKSWLAYSANRLDLELDIFKDILKNLIDQANEQEEILYESLLLGDTDQSSLILSTLKDSSSTLNIKPLTRAIYSLENSNDDDISENFREYKDIIMQINKIVTKRD